MYLSQNDSRVSKNGMWSLMVLGLSFIKNYIGGLNKHLTPHDIFGNSIIIPQWDRGHIKLAHLSRSEGTFCSVFMDQNYRNQIIFLFFFLYEHKGENNSCSPIFWYDLLVSNKSNGSLLEIALASPAKIVQRGWTRTNKQ